MSEELIDVELELGKELADEINKLTKGKLVNRLVLMILRSRVQDETIEKLESRNKNLKERIIEKQATVDQAKDVILAVVDSW